MKKILLCLTVLLTFASLSLAGKAEAGVTLFFWEPVTQFVDGSTIPDPVYYRLYCDGALYEAGTGTEALIADVLARALDGKHTCVITAALNKPCAVGADGGICESGFSPPVTVYKNVLTYFSDRAPSAGVLKMK